MTKPASPKPETKKNQPELFRKMFNAAKVVELSRPFETGMPAWPTQARYGAVVYDSWDYGSQAIHSQITFSEHTGTHVDAPKHFIRTGLSVDKLPLKALMGRGVKIDAAETKPSALLPAQAIKDFEKRHGEIEKGDIVFFRFGWDEKYALQPGAAEYLKDWPGLSQEAAEYLAAKKIKAAGSDTLALDAFGSRDNPAHFVLLGQGIPIIENTANLSELPVFSFIIGMPLKFKGGSGSPLRLAAFI